jgi:hypothetical protein
MLDEQPAEQRHRERLDGPVDEERHTDAPSVCENLAERREVHLQQHRNDHDSDEQADRDVHLGDLKARERLEGVRKQLPEQNANADAEGNPDRQVPLEEADARARRL